MISFPDPVDAPKAPPFGWVIVPSRLTGNEAQEITQACGINPFLVDLETDQPIVVAAYIALAYARRLDPDAYPWEMAGRIPVAEFTRTFPGEEAEQENLAKAVQEAIEAGEEAPNPS